MTASAAGGGHTAMTASAAGGGAAPPTAGRARLPRGATRASVTGGPPGARGAAGALRTAAGGSACAD